MVAKTKTSTFGLVALDLTGATNLYEVMHRVADNLKDNSDPAGKEYNAFGLTLGYNVQGLAVDASIPLANFDQNVRPDMTLKEVIEYGINHAHGADATYVSGIKSALESDLGKATIFGEQSFDASTPISQVTVPNLTEIAYPLHTGANGLVTGLTFVVSQGLPLGYKQ